MPYLLTMKGNFKISQETIDNFVNYREYCHIDLVIRSAPLIDHLSGFEFPIPPELLGPRKTPDMKTLGANMPGTAYRYGDPMKDPGVNKLLEDYGVKPSKQDDAIEDLVRKNPNPKTYSDHDEQVLRKVLYNPRLHFAKAPKAQAVK